MVSKTTDFYSPPLVHNVLGTLILVVPDKLQAGQPYLLSYRSLAVFRPAPARPQAAEPARRGDRESRGAPGRHVYASLQPETQTRLTELKSSGATILSSCIYTLTQPHNHTLNHPPLKYFMLFLINDPQMRLGLYLLLNGRMIKCLSSPKIPNEMKPLKEKKINEYFGKL